MAHYSRSLLATGLIVAIVTLCIGPARSQVNTDWHPHSLERTTRLLTTLKVWVDSDRRGER